MYNTFKTTSYFTVLLMVFSFAFPGSSFAKWVDRSDELETESDNTLLYVAGAVAAIAIIYLITSSGSGDSDNPETESIAPDSSATSGVFQPSKFSLAAVKTPLQDVAQDLSVLPFIGLRRSPKISGYSSKKEFGSVVLGVSVNF